MTSEVTVKQVADGLSPLQHELLSRADNIMASISSTVDKASSFAAEQVPDIAIQYVAYGRASLTTYVGIGLVLFIIALYLVLRVAIADSHKQQKTTSYGWADGRAAALMIGLPTGIVGAIVIGSNMSQFLMVWVAPKIWLIQEIVHLLKR